MCVYKQVQSLVDTYSYMNLNVFEICNNKPNVLKELNCYNLTNILVLLELKIEVWSMLHLPRVHQHLPVRGDMVTSQPSDLLCLFGSSSHHVYVQSVSEIHSLRHGHQHGRYSVFIMFIRAPLCGHPIVINLSVCSSKIACLDYIFSPLGPI